MISSTHQLNNIKISNEPLSIGFANISSEDVKMAIDSIISHMSHSYLELISEAAKEGRLSSSALFRTSNLRHLSVYPNIDQTFDNEDIKHARCYIDFEVHRQNLQNKTPIDNLLHQLSNKLSELGYTNISSGLFEIRLEKGRVTTSTDFWHFDERFKTAISICWSTIERWSTRVLNMKNVTEIDPKEFKACMTGINRAQNINNFNSIFRHGEISKFGHLYDVTNICHRSPSHNDLNQKPGINDYRLFIRYSE